MKKVKNIWKSKEGVSEVIGVILMVSITVVLGAVLYLWLGSLVRTDQEVSARITLSSKIERLGHTDTVTTVGADNVWMRKTVIGSPSARSGHAIANVYGTSKIALFGGNTTSGSNNDTWIYDASNNIWTNKTLALVPSPRERHVVASVYGDDKIILFGGSIEGGLFSRETGVYDASDNTWTNKTFAMSPANRVDHALAGVYGSSKIILFGGSTASGSNNDTWVYDASNNLWTNKSLIGASVPSNRTGHALAGVYGSSKIILFGGSTASGLNDDTWVYDANNNMWTNKNPTTAPSARRASSTASVYGDDKIVLFGGLTDSGYSGETWVYNISDNTWINKNPTTAPPARCEHSMASVYGGDKIALFGGKTSDEVLSTETWIYDVSDNIWINKTQGAPPTPRNDHSMSGVYGDDEVVLFGGNTASGLDNDTWVYDASDNIWTNKTPATAPSARSNHSMASVYGDDKVVLFGGLNESGHNGETWIYDVSDNMWTNETPATAPSARSNHSMASVYSDDKILLFGGCDENGFNGETWVYDLSENAWTNKNPLTPPSPRRGHAVASVYGYNKNILFGGNTSNGNSSETWIYDINNNVWTNKTPMSPPSPRVEHALASVYGDDKIVLFGGITSGGTLSGETWVDSVISVSYCSSNDYVITIASVAGEAPLDRLKFAIFTPNSERITWGTIIDAINAGSANTTAVASKWYAIPTSFAYVPVEPFANGKYWRLIDSGTNVTRNASYMENVAFLILDKDADGKLSPSDSIWIYADMDNSTINKKLQPWEAKSGIEVYENCIFRILDAKNDNPIISLMLPA